MNKKRDDIYYDKEGLTFDVDTLNALAELGDVLRKIHNRLTSEGYTIVDGKLKKLDIIKF